MAYLPSGKYFIRSRTQFHLACAPAEDHNPFPKEVIALPEGIQAEQWEIEALSHGRHKLSIRGAGTGVDNDLVYAFVFGEEFIEEWVITPQSHIGPNVYTIETSSGDGGWILPNEASGTQVSVQPLVVLPAEPPTFPASELWSIVPVDV